MRLLLTFLTLLCSIACVYGKCIRDRLECPDYQVYKKYPGFQIRVYPSMKWATIESSGGQFTMHRKLKSYFNGNNKQGWKMPYTYPTKTIWKQSSLGNKLEMAYMIPTEFFNDTPIPNDPTIHIKMEDIYRYYVREIPGTTVFSYQWEGQAKKFKRMLSQISHNADISKYYMCSFDPWWRIFGRKNEIWIPRR